MEWQKRQKIIELKLSQAENDAFKKSVEAVQELYKAAQKIYPVIDGAEKMIPKLEKLIKDEAVWRKYF